MPSLRGALERTEAELYAEDGLEDTTADDFGSTHLRRTSDVDSRTTAVLVDEHADMVIHQQEVDTGVRFERAGA